ncbi:MAG: hypothetical protein HY606_10995 [Planctomycetes bacterium]|nr:hypothetical protein [Planctomycetota bacterium]
MPYFVSKYFLLTTPLICLLSFSYTGSTDEIEIIARNPDGIFHKYLIVEGGFPFKKGVLSSTENLNISDNGTAVNASSRPLAYWPDGSIKWVNIVFVAENLNPLEKKTFKLNVYNEKKKKPSLSEDLNLNPDVQFVLFDGSKNYEFKIETSKTTASDSIYSEVIYYGYFDSKKDITKGAVAISTFNTLGVTRYRFKIKQLKDEDNWSVLKATVPHKNVSVRNAKQLGTKISENHGGKKVEIEFFNGSESVDCGVGRSWEVWGFDQASSDESSPEACVRPYFTPEYFHQTGVVGGFPTDIPKSFEDSFARSYQKIITKRDSDPKNSGWKNYGDFFEGKKNNLAYCGYFNQEYDPATCLFLAYISTGNQEYLKSAEDMALFFRDMCISPDGGVYQHRATLHSALAHFISVLEKNIKTGIQQHPYYKQSSKSVIAVIKDLINSEASLKAKKVLNKYKDESFDARINILSKEIAQNLIEYYLKKLKDEFEDIDEDQIGEWNMRRLFEYLSTMDWIEKFGFTDVNAVFKPFFERYGGSWDEFPIFHVDKFPDSRTRHAGGHSLAEMIVISYFLTADEFSRETALQIGWHHVNELIPGILKSYEKSVQSKGLLQFREIAWPLINLLSIWDLTEYSDPELHKQIKMFCQKLAYALVESSIDRCKGSIHSGIGMEALARYHEKTNDEKVSSCLVKWAEYWTRTQWNPDAKAFNYRKDKMKTASNGMSTLNLFGLAYACKLSGDKSIEKIVKEAFDSLNQVTSPNAKVFAMHFRGTRRAYAFIN